MALRTEADASNLPNGPALRPKRRLAVTSNDVLAGSVWAPVHGFASLWTQGAFSAAVPRVSFENALSTNETYTIDLLDLASQLDEIDVAKVMSDMARDQTALHATLSASKKLLTEVPPDLLYR